MEEKIISIYNLVSNLKPINMKTKTKPQSKFLIALATILCCIISLVSFGQSSPIVPTEQDFQGTWLGSSHDGNTIEITLTSNWKCEFKINGVPMESVNPVIGYRLPQFFPQTVASVGSPSAPEITVKFYTQDAIAGIRAVSTSASSS